MTSSDDKLRALAEKAKKVAPGEWWSDREKCDGVEHSVVKYDRFGKTASVLDTLNADHLFDPEDRYVLAEFVASLEPSNVISILDRLKAAEQGCIVPQGWQLVPKRPTDAMVDALIDSPWVVDVEYRGANKITTERRDQRYVVDGWIAMLDAAPSPPKTGA